MYVGHYDAGLRIVDISGELLGDLYRQGREIARFFSTDNEGFLANAPFVWGPQPHKGHDLLRGLQQRPVGGPVEGRARIRRRRAVSAGLLLAGVVALQLSVEPQELSLRVGETARLNARVASDARVVFFSTAPQIASVTPAGEVTAHRSGEAMLVALLPSSRQDAELVQAGDPGLRVEVPVTVAPSPLARLEIRGLPDALVAGERLPIHVVASDQNGETKDVRPELAIDDDAVASVDAFGELFEGTFHAHPYYDRPRPDLYPGDASGLVTAVAPGRATLTASVDGLTATADIVVEPSRIASLELTCVAATKRARGTSSTSPSKPEVRARFAVESYPDPSRAETVGAGAPAHILPDGRFVAEQAGLYTVLATVGDRLARKTVRIAARDVAQEIEFVGQAPVRDRITSDLWVWEGLDGRDYAALGTWNADGHALFFDVTDPSDMQRIAEVQVDARTVNDVKVSPTRASPSSAARARRTGATDSSCSTCPTRARPRSFPASTTR